MAQTFKAKTLLAASGRFSHEAIAPNLIYNTGDQNISGIKNFYSRPTVNGTGVLLSGEAASLPTTIVYTTGDQAISGIKNFTNNLVLQDNLLQSSQASGYLTGIGYSGNYDGGYFLGRTKLSQNASRLVDSSFGNNWIAKESIRTWYSVSISSDGKYQTAVDYGGKIYISSDYGNSWVAKESNRNWFGVDMSSDGKYQTAVAAGAQIYISSDYGNSWVAKESNRSWFGVAMSSDGKYQTVIINGGLGTAGIYVSINYGNTWTAKESNRFWYGVDMSSDGKYQTAVVYGGQIYISSDYGNTWVAKESNRNWNKVSMSSDGKYQTAVHYGGKIYISSDYGNTWVAKESNTNWNSISMSSDGKYQTAGVYVGKIYISSNYGNTWFAKESNRGWNSISMSSDGKYQTAVADGGYIYVSKTDELIDGNLYVDNFYATSGFFSGTLNASNLVYNTGDQTISGVKNFASRPTVNGTGVLLIGEAASLPITIVYTTGDQAISGNKTFNNNVVISENLNVTGSIRAKNIIAPEYENLLISGYSSAMVGSDINIIPGIALFSIGKINLTAAGDQVQGNINLKGNVDINNYGDNFGGPSAVPSGLGHEFIIYKSGINLYNHNASFKSFEVNQTGVYTLNKTPIYSDGQIYISGNPVLTGVDLSSFATVANLASTGSALNNSIISLSGLFTGFTGALDTAFASDAQLYTTGSTLDSKINSLSGYVTGTDATLTTNLASTGSTLNIRINNLSGYINSSASNIVFTTGNQIISGIKTFAENTTFGDTGQGDFLVISGNNFTVYGSGNFTSGLFVNGNAVLTGVDLSSYATLVNLASTGSTLDTKINSLSGYSNNTFSTINNLQSTGSNLYLMLTGFSGNLDAIYASDLQLYNTGSTLDIKINSLSGNLTSTYATISNLSLTGSNLDNKVNSLSGYSASIVNLALTGSTLDIKINSLSGNLTSTYATINNLISTGSILNSSIISLSGLFTGYTGNLDAIFASDAQLFTTGSTLNTRINDLSGYINNSSSNIVYSTGDQTISGNKSFVNRIYLNNENNESIGGTFLEGNISGISLITFQQPTDITIKSEYVGGEIKDIFSIHNNYYTDAIFGTSINTATFGDQIVIYQTGSTYGVPYSKGPYLRLGENNIISEKSTSKLGIGTTFPTEKVHISGGNLKVEGNAIANNLVYNTGNQTISGVKTFANGSNQILNTTYSTLTGLKATSGLLSGQLYRISDFVLKWNNQSINDSTVKTAASGEPLIVAALSNKQIYHLAQSEIYPQDTIYYNIDASSSYSWGTINNNVAIPDFKGWIYRRVDNLLNIDIPYDWRNITVNCCKPDVSSVPNYSGNYQYNRLDVVRATGAGVLGPTGKLYYSIVTGNSGHDFSEDNFWSSLSPHTESGTYFATDESYGFQALYDDDGIEDFRVNLPAITGSRIQQPIFTNTLSSQGTFYLNNVHDIKIEGGYSNVILGIGFYSNTIGNNFQNNTIGPYFYQNTIGNNFQNNIIGATVYTFVGNIIGDDFQYNNIARDFRNNTIKNYMRYNSIRTCDNNFIGYNFFDNITQDMYASSIGASFNVNIIQNSFQYNTIGVGFANNIIEYNFYSNTIGYNFSLNTIGNNSNSNTIGNSFSENTVGNLFYNNTIGNNFNSNTIGSNFNNNTIGNSFNTNTVGINFNANTSEDNFGSIDFTSSTHVYNSYNTTLFQNSANSMRLRYFNSSDQLVVTDPTA